MMMKKILLMTFLALGMAVVCRGDAIDPGQLKIFRADGSPGERKALFADGIYTFDGASLLALSWKHPGAQTLRLQVKFAGPPLGALFSKTRPEEGNRGIELGLGGKNFFELDGARPAGQVSDGARANIVPLWDPKAPELQPGIWYDVFLRFTPNDELALYIFDADGQKLLFRKAVPCGKIAGIKAGSGDGLLCIGGRRNSSKSCTSLVPAGTAIRLPEVWTSALAEAQIFALAKVNPDPAAALHNPAPKSYFVAVSGSDANDGLSEKTPFATIRKAADLTRPGDVVTVAPGIYYEQTTFNNAGTAEQPVTFRAAAGGLNSVLITAADRAVREKQKKWKLEDAKLGLYSIECDHQPSRVLYDQIDLFPYPELDQLKTFTLRDGYPGVENGFAFDPGAKRLYVRLHPGNRHGSADPAEHTMSIAPAAAPGYNGHHIHRAEDSIFYIAPKQPMYLVFDGFTFETPGSAAVVTGGSNVVIRNAFFKGCRFGVCGFGSPSGIFIENCTYDQAYAYSDVLDTIRKFRGSDIQKKHFFYFWARKGHNNDTEKVKNYETGIAGGVGAYWHVRNNLIVECFEGMSSWGVNKADHMQIYGNVFRRVVDNAVESENHAADMRIFNNHFHDVFEPVSWQPLDGLPWPGPVFVYRNLFDDGAEFKEIADALDPAQFLPGAFKIGASGRNWQQPHMGSIPTEMIQSRISKRVVSVPEPGFLVFNNTVLRSDGYLVTTPMPISGPAIREIANVKFFNNIFQVKGLNKLAGWDGGLFEFYNNIEVTPDSKLVNRGLMAGIGGKALDAIDGADAAGKKLGTLVFEEPDASVDAGAGELRFAAGPTAKTPVESEFRRKLRYQPSLIRTAGATPDEWGFYMLEGDFQLKLANPGKIGQITLTFRITETETEWLVLKSGRSAFTLNVSKGVTELVLTGPGEPFKIELGRLPRENWQALELDGLKRQIRFNGKEIASLPWWPGEPHAFDIAIGRNPVFDLVIR